MAQSYELSVPRVVLLVIFIVLLLVIYWGKYLKGNDNRMDTMKGHLINWKFARKVLFSVALFSIVYTFTTTKDNNFKILLLVILNILITLYNIHFSLKKCPTKIPTQYKITLYMRTITTIVVLALVLIYSNKSGLLAFLYVESRGPSEMIGTSIDTIDDINFNSRDTMPGYCPDMTDDKYKEGKQWTEVLDSEQKNNCLAGAAVGTDMGGEREDIAEDIYA